MSARKLAMVAYRALWMAFSGLVIADLGVGPTAFPWWWNFLPVILAYAVVLLVNRWGGAPDKTGVAPGTVEVAPPVTGAGPPRTVRPTAHRATVCTATVRHSPSTSSPSP